MKKLLLTTIFLFYFCISFSVISYSLSDCDDYWNIYIKRKDFTYEKVAVLVFDNEREEIAIVYPKRQDIICYPYKQLESILFEDNYACSFSKNNVQYPLTTSLDTTGEYWKIRCELKGRGEDSNNKQIDAIVADNENKQIIVHYADDDKIVMLPFASISRIRLDSFLSTEK